MFDGGMSGPAPANRRQTDEKFNPFRTGHRLMTARSETDSDDDAEESGKNDRLDRVVNFLTTILP